MNSLSQDGYIEPQVGMIPIQEFNAAITALDYQSAQWFRERFGESCQVCTEAPASQRFVLAMLSHLIEMQRTGGDCTVPLVLLAGTMLQTGYMIGRRHAEAEVLEGWMRL
jgi:hypothetical protein